MRRIEYFSVVGPGEKAIANFKDRDDAVTFLERVKQVRLNQLKRIRESLTLGEYKGELSFRTNSLRVVQRDVVLMSRDDAALIPDEVLVDGGFLIP